MRFVGLVALLTYLVCSPVQAKDSPKTPVLAASSPTSQGANAGVTQVRLPRVAVLELRTNSPRIGQGDLAALSNRLETEFQKTQSFQVLERRDMDMILREQGFQQSGACAADCQVQVGQILGVERVITGNVSVVGKIVTLNLKMVDVATGANIKSHALDIDGGMDLLLRGGAWEMAQIFAGKKKATSDHTVLTANKPKVWPWIVAGTVVVAGATVAVVYLLNQEQEAAPAKKEININYE